MNSAFRYLVFCCRCVQNENTIFFIYFMWSITRLKKCHKTLREFPLCSHLFNVLFAICDKGFQFSFILVFAQLRHTPKSRFLKYTSRSRHSGVAAIWAIWAFSSRGNRPGKNHLQNYYNLSPSLILQNSSLSSHFVTGKADTINSLHY